LSRRLKYTANNNSKMTDENMSEHGSIDLSSTTSRSSTSSSSDNDGSESSSQVEYLPPFVLPYCPLVGGRRR